MKSLANKRGLTLVEILVAVSIIVLLGAMVIGTAIRVEAHSKEQLMENTFALINAALAEFKDYDYKYYPSAWKSASERDFYLGLDFPIDCNDLPALNMVTELVCAVFGEIPAPDDIVIDPTIVYLDEYSGCQAMFFILRRIPKCMEILGKIDDSLITNLDSNAGDMRFGLNSEYYPLDRVIDPWGRTLQYDYYDEKENDFSDRKKTKRTFPVIISAGPDGEFGTSDDMKSRER